MYTGALFLHSWLRWAVILLGLLVIVRAVAGMAGRKPWSSLDDRFSLLFTITLDVQLLIGLLLYFVLSPITRAAMSDFGAAMASPGLRFFAVEHVFGMLVAIALAHRGRTRVRAVADPVRKHRVAAVFFVLAMIALLASVPWPGTPNARPLVR